MLMLKTEAFVTNVARMSNEVNQVEQNLLSQDNVSGRSEFYKKLTDTWRLHCLCEV